MDAGITGQSTTIAIFASRHALFDVALGSARGDLGSSKDLGSGFMNAECEGLCIVKVHSAQENMIHRFIERPIGALFTCFWLLLYACGPRLPAPEIARP